MFPRTSWFSFVAWLALAAASVAGLGQEKKDQAEAEPPAPLPEAIVRALRVEEPPRVRIVVSEDFLRKNATAKFRVNFSSNFPPDARQAFFFAASIWERLLTSNVEIVVNAKWEPLDPKILGGAGPAWIAKDFSGAPKPGTWYHIALANKLAKRDLHPLIADVRATFNSDFPEWFFGTSGQCPNDKYDFVTVVAHEIGHGIGFSGSMRDDPVGQASWTDPPLMYDRFPENGAGQSLLDTSLFPNPSTVLLQQLTSGDLFFNGPSAVTAHGGQRPPIYAPSPFERGSSYSHFDEAAFAAGNPNSLMTPVLVNGEVIHDPGPVGMAVLRDLGW